MKRHITALALVTVLVSMWLPEVFAFQTLTIDLPEAYLLEGPGPTYRILCKVARGEPLTLLAWEGDWFHVRRPNGTAGWLNRVVLSSNDSARYPSAGNGPAPGTSRVGRTDTSRGSFLDSIRGGFLGGRDDTLTASAGGRGITTETGSGGLYQDYEAVRYMESIAVSDEELDRFIVKGGLTP